MLLFDTFLSLKELAIFENWVFYLKEENIYGRVVSFVSLYMAVIIQKQYGVKQFFNTYEILWKFSSG